VHANIRRGDVLARYGGEEFAIVLPEVDAAHAAQMAEKLRQLVESAPIEFDRARIPVTISVGLASLAPEPSDRLVPAMEFIKRADENLYKAKRTGRNRVVA
jgi:diguanylate cyclase (GGDEF)-like protein